VKIDVPNLLSAARLLLVPVLWLLYSSRQYTAQAIVLFIAGMTDVLDGYLARRRNRISRIGSRMDTAADLALLASVYAWIILLVPELVWSRRILVIAAVVFTLGFLAIGWLRFRRIADVHIYSAKAAGVFTHAFVLFALLGLVFRWLFDIALGLATLAALEALLLVTTRDRVDERVGSILRRRKSSNVDFRTPRSSPE